MACCRIDVVVRWQPLGQPRRSRRAAETLSGAVACSQARPGFVERSPRPQTGARRDRRTPTHVMRGTISDEHSLGEPEHHGRGSARLRRGRLNNSGLDDRPAAPEPRRRRGVPRRRRRRHGIRRRSAVEVQHATRDIVNPLFPFVPPFITFSHDFVTGLLWCFTGHTNINNFLRREELPHSISGNNATDI